MLESNLLEALARVAVSDDVEALREVVIFVLELPKPSSNYVKSFFFVM